MKRKDYQFPRGTIGTLAKAINEQRELSENITATAEFSKSIGSWQKEALDQSRENFKQELVNAVGFKEEYKWNGLGRLAYDKEGKECPLTEEELKKAKDFRTDMPVTVYSADWTRSLGQARNYADLVELYTKDGTPGMADLVASYLEINIPAASNSTVERSVATNVEKKSRKATKKEKKND